MLVDPRAPTNSGRRTEQQHRPGTESCCQMGDPGVAADEQGGPGDELGQLGQVLGAGLDLDQGPVDRAVGGQLPDHVLAQLTL